MLALESQSKGFERGADLLRVPGVVVNAGPLAEDILSAVWWLTWKQRAEETFPVCSVLATAPRVLPFPAPRTMHAG